MDLTQYKIDKYENGVSNLPNYPTCSAEDLKAVFDSRSDNEIKDKHNGLIDELKEILEDINKVVSIHDDLASIVPADGEQYVIKYHDMPAEDKNVEPDENGKYPEVITDTVSYRLRIGDGVTSLADLPNVSADFQAGEGLGAIVQLDPTYRDGDSGYTAPAKATGELSFAQGKYTVASGEQSVAMNYSSEASGKRSFACNGGVSDGDASFSANAGQAIGGFAAAFGVSTASGARSFASGSGNTASGKFSYAEGSGNEASGEASHAGGYENKASGDHSFVHGKSSVVQGTNSGSVGDSNTVKFNSSFVVGANNEIGTVSGKGVGCFVAGNHNKVDNNNLVAFGKYNKPVSAAPLVVGWGQGEDSRNNILELYRGGTLRINNSYEAPEGDPALQLGDTTLTETQLKDVLNYKAYTDDLENRLIDSPLPMVNWAENASNAVDASNAINDGLGHNIRTTYATKEELQSAISALSVSVVDADEPTLQVGNTQITETQLKALLALLA